MPPSARPVRHKTKKRARGRCPPRGPVGNRNNNKEHPSAIGQRPSGMLMTFGDDAMIWLTERDGK